MFKFSVFAAPLLTYLLVSYAGMHSGQSRSDQPSGDASWLNSEGGYENFIFAQPDKNISAAEAKAHRLSPERQHPRMKEMKRGRNKKTH